MGTHSDDLILAAVKLCCVCSNRPLKPYFKSDTDKDINTLHAIHNIPHSPTHLSLTPHAPVHPRKIPTPPSLKHFYSHTLTTKMATGGNVGWDDEIVLRKRTDYAKVTRTASDINAARRAGAVVSTERKVVTNAGHVGEDFRRIAKLAESEEIVAPKAVSLDVGKAIAKARIEKKLNQKELGVLVNEKQTVVSGS